MRGLAILVAICSLLVAAPGALGAAGEVSHYPTDRLTTPVNILATPDGAIWTIDSANHNGPAPLLVKFDTAGTVQASIQLPHFTLGLALAYGADGNLWVLQSDDGFMTQNGWVNKVPLNATQTSDVVAYPYHGRTNGSLSFAAGPDGRLWFGLNHDMAAMTTGGDVTYYSTPAAGTISSVVAGADGNLWYADGLHVFRMLTAGVTDPTAFAIDGNGVGAMAWGPDGNLWYTQTSPAAVARMTTAGSVTTFPLDDAGALPIGIAAGPDGQMWFVENNTDKIASIGLSGTPLHEYPNGRDNDGVQAIVAGADHRMWFDEFNFSGVGAITTDAAVIAPPAGGGTTGGGGAPTTGGPAPAGGGSPAGGAPRLPDLPAVPVAVGCTPGRFALTDVYPLGGRTRLVGVAPPTAVGKSITLVSAWNRRTVATAKVGADGTFAAAAPLPPAALRTGNAARYVARLGRSTSAALKFSRRMYTTSIGASGRTLTFTGAATRPLARPPAPVTIRAATSCAAVASGTVVATATVGAGGRFSASFTLPAALATAPVVYFRAETAVRKSTRNRKTYKTYTLVRGVRIGG